MWHTSRFRLASTAPLLAALLFGVASAPVSGQIDPSPPDTVAAEYLRGFQAAVWDGLAQRLHADALAYLRLAIDIQVEADTSGWALANLGGADSRADYDARDDARVFVDVMRWTQDNARGLLSSLVSREAELIGIVAESAAVAHAVYRVRTIASGAEPVVQVATLVRTDRGWKVRESPEIRTLHTALRGIPVPRGPGSARPARASSTIRSSSPGPSSGRARLVSCPRSPDPTSSGRRDCAGRRPIRSTP